jgi:uncharacterized Zn finger protein (UPF0148 family)
MFIKDGSSEDYAEDNREYGYPHFDNLYAWGWLEDSLPNENKWSSEKEKEKEKELVVERLKKFPRVDSYCGDHLCLFCSKEGKTMQEIYNSGATFCGSIKIPYNGKVYCSPHGVEHYITQHNYCPDREVIDAILNGEAYTEEALIELGKTLPDVIAAIERREERIAQMNLERERARQASVERVNSPEFRNKLANAMNSLFDVPSRG